ncbi:MAG: hypothetical protein ABR591_03195 [Candidatus Velthaea sp.]
MTAQDLQIITRERPHNAFSYLGLQHRPDSVAFAGALSSAVTTFFLDVLFGGKIAGFQRAAESCDGDAVAEAAAFVAGVAHRLHANRCNKLLGRSADVSDWLRTAEIISQHMYRPGAVRVQQLSLKHSRRTTHDELARATLHALEVFFSPVHAAAERQSSVAAGNYTNYVARLLNDADLTIWEPLATATRPQPLDERSSAAG